MSQWYDLKDKVPVPVPDIRKWRGLSDARDRTVGKTKAAPNVEVSTVFLGLDHAMPGNAPQLFETMVFGGPLDQEQERYPTWADAEAGHERWVRLAKIADTAALSLAPETTAVFECGVCHKINRLALTIEPVEVVCPGCETRYRLQPTLTICPIERDDD